MTAVIELGDRIAGLTLAEAVELKTYLSREYGLEAAAWPADRTDPIEPDVVIQPAATEFDVTLSGVDPAKKIAVIKTVRELTGQGLAEAKATVESAPRVLARSVPTEQAAAWKAKLEAAGGTVAVTAA